MTVVSHKERTLEKPVCFSGKSLHTGKFCKVRLLPAPEETGVVFRRIDKGGEMVPAHIQYAQKYVRCSGLRRNGISIRTCEHLLAALYACRIHNVFVELDREELPIFDGSCAPFVEEVKKGGSIEQDCNRQIIKITKTIESREGERFVRIEPADCLSIALSLTLRRFSNLSWEGSLSPENFIQEIASARTFSPLRHALPMKIFSLITGVPIARGANLKNLLLFYKGRLLNPGGFRFENEFARHRVLDVVGDLALAGASVYGKITAFRSSHSLNQDLVAQISAEYMEG